MCCRMSWPPSPVANRRCRPASSAVVFVVDGLGALQLRAHAGHARLLAPRMGKKDVARSVFPSTTAAALTSLLTGEWPGRHGLVGYSVLDASRDVLINQLSGWEKEGIDPATWQRVPTVFERSPALRSFAVGLPAVRRQRLHPGDPPRRRVRLRRTRRRSA